MRSLLKQLKFISFIGLASALSLGLASVVSCSSAPKANTQAEAGFKLRPFQEETLPNGLRLIFINDQSLPRVSFQMMVQAGTVFEPTDKGGLTALTFGVLDQGTTKKSALELADAFAQIGAEFGAQPGADMSFISASGISPSRSEMLKLYHEVIVGPTFAQKELDRRRSQYQAALQKALDQPQGFTDQVFDQTLFGQHPYGRNALGTPASLKAIQRQDLVQYYQTWVQPKNSILAVVGQIDEAFMNEVRATMANWKESTVLPSAPVRPAVSEGAIQKLVTKKDLQQTQIRMGHLGIQRSDPDFLKLRLASLILGGAFGSRLNQRVRDDLGLTYSIHSSSDARLDRGAFEVNTFTRNEKAAETIAETRKVLAAFVKDGVTQQELDSSKALMIGQFPSALETPDRLAYNLLVLRRYGIGDDYLSQYNQRVGAVTLAEVNAAIHKHIKPEMLRIVVYGDQEKVGAALKAMGSWETVTAESVR